MSQLTQDLRYALRQLRRSPGFTVTAVLTLALGIGANTAAFTLLHQVLLNPLPVANPGRLYRIGDGVEKCCQSRGSLEADGDFEMFSDDLYRYIRKSAPEFEELAAADSSVSVEVNIRWKKERAQALAGEYVSGNYFATLGVKASQGRLLADSDDLAGAAPAAVISYGAWKRVFASDPSAVGSTVSLNGHAFTLVGVAPKGFFGDRISEDATAIWLPLADEPLIAGRLSVLHDKDTHWLYPFGRVRPGTDIHALQAKVSVLLRQWLFAYPLYATAEHKAEVLNQHVVIVAAGRGIQQMSERYKQGLSTLMILSTAVLLIACANIANLLLARGIARRADLSIRMALGAPRGRLLRQMLTESLLLSFIGGVFGLGLAYVGSALILALTFSDSADLPIHATPSLPVLAFAFAASVITGILFGTAPARLSQRIQPAEVLRGLNHSSRGLSYLPQKALIVIQAGLSLVLVVGAFLTARSLYKLSHQDLGLATANRYVLHFDLTAAGYKSEDLPALYSKMQNRFKAIGGVNGVGFAGYSFLEGWNWFDCVQPRGWPTPGDLDTCYSSSDAVSASYLDVLGIPMLLGHGFDDQNISDRPPVVVINETFARRYFPNQNPIGKFFSSSRGGKASTPMEVVGVFRDAKTHRPHNPMQSMYLYPLMKSRKGGAVEANSMVVHFDRVPDDVEALLTRAMAEVDPNLTVNDLRTMDSQVSATLQRDRLMARLAAVYGLLALALASVGLYGVTSYIVARRTSEIGIRMALGATRGGVILLVLRGVAWQIGIGLALGIPCALAAGYFIRSLLYDVQWYDPIGVVGGIVVLTLCAIAAGYIPARRAASIQPMQALRSE
jgi:macrolide transport system ATP-binding/permease protein